MKDYKDKLKEWIKEADKVKQWLKDEGTCEGKLYPEAQRMLNAIFGLQSFTQKAIEGEGKLERKEVIKYKECRCCGDRYINERDKGHNEGLDTAKAHYLPIVAMNKKLIELYKKQFLEWQSKAMAKDKEIEELKKELKGWRKGAKKLVKKLKTTT